MVAYLSRRVNCVEYSNIFQKGTDSAMKSKINMDDGFNAELVETAFFDGILEMPKLQHPKNFIIPERMIPINKLSASVDHSEMIVPYVFDNEFGDIVRNPQAYVETFRKFPAMASLDNSIYIDSPLTVQIANVYRSRAIACYFQSQGINVIPNVRWGDERSYTTCVLPECFAFWGIPKHTILCIGTYGACQSKEEKYHLRNGLIAMLDILEPEMVLVYGSMPDKIFQGLYDCTRFINYPDWTSSKKKVV